MTVRAHTFDLAGLRLSSGEGRRLALKVSVETLVIGGERYRADPHEVLATLDVSRMAGGGYALRLRLAACLCGPCMRCLTVASPVVEVDVREVSVPGEGEELTSPYVEAETLDLGGWARDAFALAAPVKVLCREDCAGLCPECAANLNEVGLQHSHPRAPDPRWAKLGELELE